MGADHVEASKNAKLSHRQPQGSTTKENSLGFCWQGKQQRAVPRNKSNCPCGREMAQGWRVWRSAHLHTRELQHLGDAELLRHSQLVRDGRDAGGGSCAWNISDPAALGPALPSMNILCEQGHPDVGEQLCLGTQPLSGTGFPPGLCFGRK